MKNIELVQIFTTGKNACSFDECKLLVRDFCVDVDQNLLEHVYGDVHDIFDGQYPGFGLSNDKYHDFYHTCATVLATTRLFHGLALDGREITPVMIEQGILCALFHDIGWLPSDNNQLDSQVASIENHEERSIAFLSHYLKQQGFSTGYCSDCTDIINCTNLDFGTDKLKFRTDKQELTGYVVGSADILAQMADRCYLEKLPYLFRERGYSSQFHCNTPVELMQRTSEFYSKIVMERLEQTFQNIYLSMRSHFRKRWQLDRDLYSENIVKNIQYLKKITSECEDEFQCIEKRLRRNISSFGY